MFCTLTLSLSPLSPYLSLFFSTSSPSFDLTSKISPYSISIRHWNRCWGRTCFVLSLSHSLLFLPISLSFSPLLLPLSILLPKFLRTASSSGLGINVEVRHVSKLSIFPSLLFLPISLSPLSPSLGLYFQNFSGQHLHPALESMLR
jgi:hypothetical protein